MKWVRSVGLLGVVGIVAAVFWVSQMGVKRPAQQLPDVPAARRVAAAIPYWDQAAAWKSFMQQATLFDSISLFWYVLRQDGSIDAYPAARVDRSMITQAQAAGVKVLALIANLPAEDEGGDWDAERVAMVIGTDEARARHIEEIVELVRRSNFDGVTIDYEALPGNQRRNFTRFIEELAQALHREGKLLAVALHPKVGEGNPRYANGSQAQDWKQLAQQADHLYLMTYEEHWATSQPGPAASLPWLEEILMYARAHIPADKLFVGIPLYGYDWSDSRRARGLTYADVQALVSTFDPRVEWDSEAGSWHFTYTRDGQDHEVWFEDARSVQAKLDLIQNLKLSNVAFWRLGDEDQSVWPIVWDWSTAQ